MWLVSLLLGSLVPTFLVSRLFVWLMRSWQSPVGRAAIAAVATWLLTALLAGIGMADGGAFAGTRAGLLYAPACLIWFAFDWWRLARPRVQQR
jgi:hypothetical protein